MEPYRRDEYGFPTPWSPSPLRVPLPFTICPHESPFTVQHLLLDGGLGVHTMYKSGGTLSASTTPFTTYKALSPSI